MIYSKAAHTWGKEGRRSWLFLIFSKVRTGNTQRNSWSWKDNRRARLIFISSPEFFLQTWYFQMAWIKLQRLRDKYPHLNVVNQKNGDKIHFRHLAECNRSDPPESIYTALSNYLLVCTYSPLLASSRWWAKSLARRYLTHYYIKPSVPGLRYLNQNKTSKL